MDRVEGSFFLMLLNCRRKYTEHFCFHWSVVESQWMCREQTKTNILIEEVIALSYFSSSWHSTAHVVEEIIIVIVGKEGSVWLSWTEDKVKARS